MKKLILLPIIFVSTFCFSQGWKTYHEFNQEIYPEFKDSASTEDYSGFKKGLNYDHIFYTVDTLTQSYFKEMEKSKVDTIEGTAIHATPYGKFGSIVQIVNCKAIVVHNRTLFSSYNTELPSDDFTPYVTKFIVKGKIYDKKYLIKFIEKQ